MHLREEIEMQKKNKLFSHESLAIALVCLIISTFIVWQFRSVQANLERSKIENLRMTELQDELLNQKLNNEKLNSRLAELTKENEKIKNKESAGTQIELDLKRAKRLAGLTAVSGEGVIVTVSNKGENTVSETDILSILNELRASGAEALEVNGERMVAMSEVREAGRFIVINSKQTSSPFVIKAIGKADDLYKAITMIGGIKETQELFMNFTIAKSTQISISGVPDNGTVLKDSYFKDVIN